MALFQHQNGLCATKGCGTKLTLNRPRNFIKEHDIALGRKGSNDLANKSLRCIPCANKKTRGSGATTKGSDIGEIASERRIIRTGKMTVNKPLLGEIQRQKPKRLIPGSKASPWRKPMRGRVEKR